MLETLARIGKVEPRIVHDSLDAEPWGYRRKARLGVRKVDKKGRVLVGFRERRAPLLADMDSCVVLAGGVGDMLPALVLAPLLTAGVAALV